MDELWRLNLEFDSRGFSNKTKKLYLFFVRDFLQYVSKKPSEANTDDIKKYVSHLIIDKGYTNITANLAISSLKFYFSNVIHSRICDEIKRPKREQSLPTVLSKEEVKRLFESTNNSKHIV